MACSFDVLPDELGGPRTAFPHTLLLAAGTQAAAAGGNTLTLLKLSNLTQGRHGSRVRSLDTLPYPTLAVHVLPGGYRGQQRADGAQAQRAHAWGPRQSGIQGISGFSTRHLGISRFSTASQLLLA